MVRVPLEVTEHQQVPAGRLSDHKVELGFNTPYLVQQLIMRGEAEEGITETGLGTLSQVQVV